MELKEIRKVAKSVLSHYRQAKIKPSRMQIRCSPHLRKFYGLKEISVSGVRFKIVGDKSIQDITRKVGNVETTTSSLYIISERDLIANRRQKWAK